MKDVKGDDVFVLIASGGDGGVEKGGSLMLA